MEIRIFENGTVKECLSRCLAEGYVPADSETVWNLGEKKKIPVRWYNTRTCFIKGKIRQMTIGEMRNIEKFYKQGGRVLFVDLDGSGLIGSDDLNDSGRFVGVKGEE